MLARKYNYEEQWAQSEQERLRELKELQERRQRIRKANYKLFRRRLFVTVGFILVMYAVTVMRSAALVSAGNADAGVSAATQECGTENRGRSAERTGTDHIHCGKATWYESGPQQHLCKSRQSIGYS